MLGDRIGNWSVPHFIKQMIADSSLTPCWQSFPHTFEQPTELFDTLYTWYTFFVTLYSHSPGIHFRAKRSLLTLLVYSIISSKSLIFYNIFSKSSPKCFRNRVKIFLVFIANFHEISTEFPKYFLKLHHFPKISPNFFLNSAKFF